ncbi:DUF4167 domain-containing protein [Pseudohalocynthiibacter aestuariivivens]|jgi:Domain of unknown function (DUF4167)|uniref:DUF4167 domain-containing protein n=1 Tax=Pseudohalocynthiibacter aestuariivivens TaxID=1591409 RepID=A0ABV5JIL9_9RHOB|nr:MULTISPECIES: DUF4167 domain-containing protein [Pseudohalocynthiibacter]MBS9716540.1 DUF4167 domain-containing protein [Pseudohalocynthiibacter aestuariivivens]MCK0101609.1 DUF4167 domain-containing protein [Pseudohalocynthiibacter sp. F2068]
MRSTKQRTRGKPNRNRNTGNNLNRVFDSSGPEGKVRGTPQQIIDKYQQLTRDAQLSNDRVAAESFQQHAEHYTRLLGEAQREAEARRLEQEAQREQQNSQREAERAERNESVQAQTSDARPPQPSEGQGDNQPRERRQPRRQERRVDPAEAPQPDMMPPIPMMQTPAESDLVETPESASASEPKPKLKRPRKPRVPKAEKPKADAAPEAVKEEPSGGMPDTPEAPEAAE